jgi:tRNA dimethylallyltransferase
MRGNPDSRRGGGPVPRLLVLVGPTAVGKTAVAMELARRLNGEIVSADSMQIYKYLDIGTGKPTPAERAAVPHHLIDFVEPDQPYSVADFKDDAERAFADIWRRGKQPLLVGGTGLYIRAIVQGLTFAGGPGDPELRQRLWAEAEAEGNRALHARLAEVDPETAARLHPNQRKQIIRALEVYERTGRPLSQWHAQAGQSPPAYALRRFALTMERSRLYERINARVKAMFEAGWVEEVRALQARGYDERLPAMRSLGYGRILAYLRGETDLATALARTQQDTRRFAKRQYTWFRADPANEWLTVTGVESTAEEILARWAEDGFLENPCLKTDNMIQ